MTEILIVPRVPASLMERRLRLATFLAAGGVVGMSFSTRSVVVGAVTGVGSDFGGTVLARCANAIANDSSVS